jgi:hypothetical protein
MKPIWKWVIGIVAGLVVVAAVVGGLILVRNFRALRPMAYQVQRVQPGQPSVPWRTTPPTQPSLPGQRVRPGQPTQPGQQVPPFGYRYPLGPGYGVRGFGMMGGMMPVGGFFLGLVGGFFVGFFVLGLLVVLVLGILWLNKTYSISQQAPAPAPVPLIEMRACVNCGKAVQADWRNCPYCGRKQ